MTQNLGGSRASALLSGALLGPEIGDDGLPIVQLRCGCRRGDRRIWCEQSDIDEYPFDPCDACGDDFEIMTRDGEIEDGACPECGHLCLRIVRDANICDECGYTRRNQPAPYVSVPVSAYQPRPGT